MSPFLQHRRWFPALVAVVLVCAGCGGQFDAQDQTLLVETACGQCRFGLPGHGCDLAVRIEGASYFVDGSGIDDYGDAHADAGFCNAVRQARVTGHVEDGRFVATSFELLDLPSD